MNMQQLSSMMQQMQRLNAPVREAAPPMSGFRGPFQQSAGPGPRMGMMGKGFGKVSPQPGLFQNNLAPWSAQQPTMFMPPRPILPDAVPARIFGGARQPSAPFPPALGAGPAGDRVPVNSLEKLFRRLHASWGSATLSFYTLGRADTGRQRKGYSCSGHSGWEGRWSARDRPAWVQGPGAGADPRTGSPAAPGGAAGGSTAQAIAGPGPPGLAAP